MSESSVTSPASVTPLAAPPATGSQPSTVQTPAEQTQEGNPVPYARFKELNDTRKAEKEELDRLRTEEAKRQETEALKNGEHEKVIGELRPKAERMTQLEKTLEVVIAAEIEAIPEARRTLIPDLPVEKKLEWIAKNRSFLLDQKKGTVNAPTNPASGTPGGDNQRVYTSAEISDSAFYQANRADILKAQSEGRIRD